MKVHIIASKSFVEDNPRIFEHLVAQVSKKAQITIDWMKRVVKHKDAIPEDNPEKIYRDEVKHIRESDGIIAEISNRSLGVGFQISYALANKKPVLCLYDERMGHATVSKLLRGSTDKILYLEKYDPRELSILDQLVESFIEKIGGLNLVKFNFIATKEIKDYIERGSQKNNISQSEFLREKIDEVMGSDEDYKKIR